MNLWMIILFLVIGFAAGYYNLFGKKFLNISELITNTGLIILLMAMGAKIGVDERVLNEINRIGFQAFLLAVASILFSIILVKIYTYKLSFSTKSKDRVVEGGGEVDHSMTLMIIGSVILGVMAGIYLPVAFFSLLDRITTYALAVLLFGIGVGIGYNRVIFKQIREMGWQILVIPLLVAAGSIIGSVISGYLVGLTHSEAAAVGAGFGWYSLSGVLLAQIHSVELGSLAFLTNVFRELLTIITLPLVVKYFGKLTAIAPGGATTMDVTLPVIKKTAGDEVVIPAFLNGVVLSFLVPILVPFLVNL